VCNSSGPIGDQGDTPPDLRVARRAGAQHGQIAVWQLRECGVSSNAVAVRVKNGRLHRVHRGVYAVGHDAVTLQGRFMAAVLACGHAAVLSHFAAAAQWGFVRWDDRQPEVTVCGSGVRRIEGVRVHRSRSLDRRDVLRCDGIRITSPARTALDLAATTPHRALRRMIRQAQAEKRVNIRQLVEVLSRANGHPGAAALRAVIADGPAPTRSELEDLVLDLVDAAGIDRPQINQKLVLDGRSIVPDFLWRDLRVVIEADGAAWHDNKLTRENDADKQAILEAYGYRVLRITYAQVVHHPRQTIARIRTAIAAAA